MKKNMEAAMQAMNEARKVNVPRQSIARNAIDRDVENQAYRWHDGRNDDGRVGKQLDVIVRYILTGKVEYCHRAGVSDVKGKGFATEVKHAQSWIVNPCYLSKDDAEKALEELTCLRSQFVAYAWKVDSTIADANDKMRIVSSHAFIKFMKAIGKLHVKPGSAGSGNADKYGIAIQSFHNSRKAEKLLNDFLSTGWTLAEHSAEYEYYCD